MTSTRNMTTQQRKDFAVFLNSLMATDDTPLQDAAKCLVAEDKSAALISEVRQLMVLGRPSNRPAYAFFTTLLLKLEMIPCWAIPTACTDGARILYNPAFVAALSREQAMGLCVHEVLHCANQHHTRRGAREPRRWNLSCDLAINVLITESGFQLPNNGCFPGKGAFRDLPAGLSAEEYYPLLPEHPTGGGTKGDDPGQCGGVTEPGTGQEAELTQAEADWQRNVAQARDLAQKTRGTMPAGLARMIGQTLAPKVDWREVLREFISRHAKNQYGWNPPNRRFIAQRLYLPSLKGQSISGIVLAVDTSGSIGPKELDQFGGEIEAICQLGATGLTIIYHDSAIANVQTWEPHDGPLVLEPKGGGGTSHKCVFDWLAKSDSETSCLICLTDMASEFPKEGPDYPVLWCSTDKKAKAPFGRLIYLEIDP